MNGSCTKLRHQQNGDVRQTLWRKCLSRHREIEGGTGRLTKSNKPDQPSKIKLFSSTLLALMLMSPWHAVVANGPVVSKDNNVIADDNGATNGAQILLNDGGLQLLVGVTWDGIYSNNRVMLGSGVEYCSSGVNSCSDDAPYSLDAGFNHYFQFVYAEQTYRFSVPVTSYEVNEYGDMVAVFGTPSTPELVVQNELPNIVNNKTVTIDEHDFFNFASSDLQAMDPDGADAEDLVFTVTSAPSVGLLVIFTNDDDRLVEQGDSFTQADIDNGSLVYVHNSDQTSTSDSFDFSLSDGVGSVDNNTFNFNITLGDDAPLFDAVESASTTEDVPFDLALNAIDPEGGEVTLRLADGSPSWLQIETQTKHQVSTFAGRSDSIDGNGIEASFVKLDGVTIDTEGNMYVADYFSHRIHKITPSGEAFVFAGSGKIGSDDGNGTDASFRTPFGLTVDGNGNVFVADHHNHLIRKITPSGSVTTFAGSGNQGSTSGSGIAASFKNPSDVAVDSMNNIYVADSGNHLIRKITPSGNVTTFAGTGSSGNTNDNGSAASFYSPSGVAVDTDDNLYVTDALNNSIRKITPNGDVTTLAGSGSRGSSNGNGAEASFSSPSGLSVDAEGNVYVADSGNHIIRKITPAGDVTTLAGSGSSGRVNGDADEASFYSPQDVVVDAEGNIYVADQTFALVRKITPPTGVSLTGTPSNAEVGEHDICIIASDANNNETEQCFPLTVTNVNDAPTANDQLTSTDEDVGVGITLTGSDIDAGDSITYAIVDEPEFGTLSGTAPNVTYTPNANINGSDSFTFKVTDSENASSDIAVVTIAVNAVDDAPTLGVISNASTAQDTRFTLALDATDPEGDDVTYRLKDGSPNWLQIATQTEYQVSTFAGSGQIGSDDGNGTAASFKGISNVAVDNDGNLYVADGSNHSIRKITPNGDVTTLAGSGKPGDSNGNGSAASFRYPLAVAVDTKGNVFVADEGNDLIRKITPNGDVTTFAGSGNSGNANGNGIAASFDSPQGIAVDVDGNVYVADTDNHLIRKITPNGDVTTFAGSGNPGDSGGNSNVASLNHPQGVAVDAAMNVYEVSAFSGLIRKITPTGEVTILAGSGQQGDSNGQGTAASFRFPQNIAVSTDGNIYVTDLGNNLIRQVNSNGDVTTFAGTGSEGSVNGNASAATFALPSGVAVDTAGNVYVTDAFNNIVRKITPPAGISTTGTPTNAEVGEHDICIIASDANNNETEQCFTLTVTNVNDAPSANEQIVSTDEDAGIGITLTGSDIDAGDRLTYVVVDAPEYGTLSGTAPNVTYTPNAHFNGDDSFTFKVTDSENVSSGIAVVTIAVSAVNDVPVATAQTLNGVEDTSISVTLSGSDADDDGLTYAVITPPSNGQLMGSGDIRSYVPNANFNGSDSFSYRANDGKANSTSATVTINIASVNDAPVATDDSVSVEQNSIATLINALANDTDIESSRLTVASAQATHGQVVVNGDGSLSYTPNQDYVGSDTINYVIRDGDNATDSANVNVTVTAVAVNTAPVAVTDSASVNAGDSIMVDVLANDTDAENDRLSIVSAMTAVGEIDVVDNQVLFRAGDNLSGLSVINYLIRDEAGNTAEGVLNVMINNAQGIVLNVPADLCDADAVNATGLLTRVNVGEASATDAQGRSLGVSLVDSNTLLAPGRHTILWQTEDRDGNRQTAEQIVCVNPQVSLGLDSTVVEGAAANFTVSLNGDAPSYPVTVTFTIAGSANSADHDLQSGEITIDEGTSKSVGFDIEQDGVDEGDETIIISLDSSNNLGAISAQTLTITEQNIAPVATLTVQQDGQKRTTVAIDGGEVVIRSGATDANSNDTLTYEWQTEDALLINTSINDDIFSFVPTDLEAGLYTITLTVTDNGSPNLSDVETLNLNVIASLPVLTDADSDGDNIPDNLEGLGDSDGDGIADYLDGISGCNIQQEASGESNRFLVESPVGTCLRQGQFAMQGDTNGLRLTQGDINNIQTLPVDVDIENIGGVFDYVVTDLAQTGDVVAIVIPQRRPIPDNAVYRKFNDEQGWHNFVENANNSLWSAPGEQGQCPSPHLTPETSSTVTHWTQGLTPGHWCVQMLIEDGGVNDDDNTANGTVVDPGFVGVVHSDNRVPAVQNDTAELVINTSITVDVLANDTDADNDRLTISSATAVIGSVEISNNQLRYTPPANYTGLVSVAYGVSDGQGGTTQGELRLMIIANTPPVVANEQSQINQGQAVTTNLLTNDSDGENDTLSLVAVDNQHVEFSASGQVTFTPPAEFFGVVTIHYTVEDSAGNQSQGQWQVNVIQVHEPTVSTSGGGSMGMFTLFTLLLLGIRQVSSRQSRNGQRVCQEMMMGKE